MAFRFYLTTLPVFANAFKGEMTYYASNRNPVLGSCGQLSPVTGDFVALSKGAMENGANPNKNPKCGTTICVCGPGLQQGYQAKIVDTCDDCKQEDIDVNEELFGKFAASK
ncbi:MAG: hypothetical protein Q9184_000287, partial [Pyrenodesmia sp. 2 TL-2023]